MANQLNQGVSVQAGDPNLKSLLSMGFRPLYLAGTSWAVLSMLMWVFIPDTLSGTLQGWAWHAHEMLWGFIAAIAVGFLMTASATWTGINPLNGVALALTCMLWLIARVGFLVPYPIAFLTASACQLSFFLFSAGALARVVLQARSRRNYVLPILLFAFGTVDALFLKAVWNDSTNVLTVRFEAGLLCMAVISLLVARRVIPFFAMRAIPGLRIPMHESSAKIQLVAGTAVVVFLLFDLRQLLPIPLAVCSGLCAVQLMTWKPWSVRRIPLLWILYIGYASIGIGFAITGIHALGFITNPAIHIHMIAIGGLTTLIIGMVTRTALGHLSKPLTVDSPMLTSFFLILIAFLLRLVAIIPSSLSWICIQFSAAAWIGAFSVYIICFFPMMIRPSDSIEKK